MTRTLCLGGVDRRPCGEVVDRGRCRIHAAEWERRRGTVTERFGPGWAATSRRIVARDGGRCHWCGGRATTADHLLSRERGGTDDDDNLVAACVPCNSSKGATRSAPRRAVTARGRGRIL